MPSNRAIYTPENSRGLAQARATGKRVMDLRDDGKWHDITAPGSAANAGKGDGHRPRQISDEEYTERYCLAFGHQYRGGICRNCYEPEEA